MSDIYPIAVPKWGIEMVEGTIAAWNKEPGDAVAKGDEVFEMESDKIVNVWESPVDGVLRRRIAEEGETLPVGDLLGIIAPADVSEADIEEFVASFSSPAAKPEPAAEAPAAASAAAATAAPAAASIAPGDNARRVNPVVRRLAAELGVDLEAVVGTGRNGRITKEDVELAAKESSAQGGDTAPAAVAAAADAAAAVAAAADAAAAVAAAAVAPSEFEAIPLSPIRKTIARRLTEAKQEIPHFYLTAEYELDGLLAHRQNLKAAGDKVSVNDLLVWCVARALIREPRVNVNLVGDTIHQFKHANVAVAIATEDGLFPATVYKADTLSPQEISAATAALADKAKSGKLAKEDISNGSFTVSNLGMFGVSTFSAIVNPPMGAILALGRAQQRVVVKAGEPAVATVINASLSCDHRVIDGAIGAGFLAVLAEEIAALE
jgi:pyruvate dehydrogenase E2 component (dihydrolipoamide acetyltransferase)